MKKLCITNPTTSAGGSLRFESCLLKLRHQIMKLLLTSAGISNASIHNALVELLAMPIAEASALFVPTAIYALPNGPEIARTEICGSLRGPFLPIGVRKSLGLLELAALPSILIDLLGSPSPADRRLTRGRRRLSICVPLDAAVRIGGNLAVAAAQNRLCGPKRRQYDHDPLWNHLRPP